MESLTLGMKTFFIGLIAYTVVMIASNFYHRWKKKYSFTITESNLQIVVKRSSLTNVFNCVAHFFLYSLLTIITTANKNEKTAFTQITVIYSICLVAVVIEYFFNASFKIVVDKETKTLTTKDVEYPLSEATLEISDRSLWRTDDYDAYGLYIKTFDGRKRLLYGSSVLWDIKELKCQIDDRINSHQQ